MEAVSAAGQAYLKAVFHLTHRGRPVTTGAVAIALGVASPSATAMLQRLERDDLVGRTEAHEFRLTEAGERVALRVVRRHRLVETFLAEVVGMSWDEVHVEAELLEHAVSDRLEQRIDELLGHPAHDPHGDPIPPRDGPHREEWGDPLARAEAGDRFRVGRVSDDDPEVLRHLATIGVRPGTEVVVERLDPFGGPMWIRLADGAQHALGTALPPLVHGTITHEVAS